MALKKNHGANPNVSSGLTHVWDMRLLPESCSDAVPLTPRDSEISAFVTPDSYLQYTLMPLGLRNRTSMISKCIHHFCEMPPPFKLHGKNLGATYRWCGIKKKNKDVIIIPYKILTLIFFIAYMSLNLSKCNCHLSAYENRNVKHICVLHSCFKKYIFCIGNYG